MKRAQTSQEGQRRCGRRPPLVPDRPRLGGLLLRRPRPARNLPQDTRQLGLDQLRHQALALIQHHYSVIFSVELSEFCDKFIQNTTSIQVFLLTTMDLVCITVLRHVKEETVVD